MSLCYLYKEVMLFGVFVCVCNNSNSSERILLKLFMWIGPDKRKKRFFFNFGKDPEHILPKKSQIFTGSIFTLF